MVNLYIDSAWSSSNAQDKNHASRSEKCKHFPIQQYDDKARRYECIKGN